ncbi:hypothetical protein HNQ80_001204 [Anaerosolibacter carboniphilus]|uniref:DUF401 family protein n=1 Tax=Anaerosolibacter carboniphilus TaxID=1417629 RepID=A0A841KYA8_9FIRM|nr:DUF401 family protein [Anaerosolibacter carboniphilus]MBB6215115.1 hypothetical protein [Anaerosolibacter carboniphilus]
MIVLTMLLSMGLTLFLVSRKINMGLSLAIGAVLLALLNGKDFHYLVQLIFRTFSEYATLTLALTIAFITILGHLMEKYLLLDRMIEILERMLGSAKATILLAPAIIGTLLVTGGALMSCPVVGSLGKRLELPGDKMASINLIFRHALYFVFPLSTTILLATQLGGFSVWDFIKLQFPMAVVMYVAGYLLYLKGSPEPKIEAMAWRDYFKSVLLFFYYSSPILVSLLGVVAFQLSFHVSLVFGILLSIGIHLLDERTNPKYHVEESLWLTLYKGIKPSMVVVILGIMIFKNVVNDLDGIYTYLNSLLAKGIPVELIIFIACAAISFPLGSTQPGIAILFPMILPLAPDAHTKLLYAMFVYTTSFMFYYISPIHLCQVLTLEFFEVKMKDLYKNYTYILPATYGTMILVYFLAR